jgi:hypothetical protein
MLWIDTDTDAVLHSAVSVRIAATNRCHREKRNDSDRALPDGSSTDE